MNIPVDQVIFLKKRGVGGGRTTHTQTKKVLKPHPDLCLFLSRTPIRKEYLPADCEAGLCNNNPVTIQHLIRESILKTVLARGMFKYAKQTSLTLSATMITCSPEITLTSD